MARVPTYDSATVDERPLPGVRQESIATPEFLGSAANSEIALGAGTLRAGTGIDAIGYQMQTRDNVRKVQDATTIYGERVLQFQTDTQAKRTGAAARGVVTDFGEWHKKQLDDISAGLGNDAQREAFIQVARTKGLAARHDLATFEVAQTRKAGIDSFNASTANNIGLGAVAVTPEAADTFKNQVVVGTRAFAALNNMQPEVEQALLEKNLTEFHAQRIQNLARADPAGAMAYFEANKAEINGSKRAEIGEFAQKATAEQMGTNAAGDIWAAVGPAGGLDKMEEAARTQFKNDPFTLKATISNLRERQQAFDKGEQTRTDNLAAAANKAVLDNVPVSLIRKMPEFIALSTSGPAGIKQANQIIEHAENKSYQRTIRASAEESRAQQIMARRGMGEYLTLSNPDTLNNMTEAQILNKLPTLGNELTQHLMNSKRSLVKTGDKIVEARMDQQDFDHIANEVGLKPYDPKKSEDERAALGELKFGIEQKIDAAQTAKKAPLTRQEKMQIMRSEMDNKVLVDEWGRDPSKPVITLTPDEQKGAYVVVDGKEVKLASIPAADRAQITAARRRAGLPVTEQSIAEMWARKSTTGSGKASQIPGN